EPRMVECRQRFQEAFAAVVTGEAENDGFNQLVLGAALTWRQAMLLRAYAKYLRQAGSTFSQGYIERTLQANPTIVGLLVRLFETRLDPAAGEDRDRAAGRLVERVTTD